MELNVKNICNKCGEVNELDAINLKRALVTCVQTDDEVLLTYYICKRCSTLKVVQIDDSTTTKAFTDLKKLITRAAKKRLKGKSVPPEYKERKDKLEETINKHRVYLEDKFTGKDFKKDNNILVKNLTFYRKDDIIDSNL